MDNNNSRKVIDTETVMVNLLQVDKKRYCTMRKVQKLCTYIYEALVAKGVLDSYTVCFSVDFEAIERTVLYNNKIFRLDMDEDIIYLRESVELDDLAEEFRADDMIIKIIENFNQVNVTFA